MASTSAQWTSSTEHWRLKGNWYEGKHTLSEHCIASRTIVSIPIHTKNAVINTLHTTQYHIPFSMGIAVMMMVMKWWLDSLKCANFTYVWWKMGHVTNGVRTAWRSHCSCWSSFVTMFAKPSSKATSPPQRHHSSLLVPRYNVCRLTGGSRGGGGSTGP